MKNIPAFSGGAIVAVSYAAPTMLKMSFTFKVPVDTAKSVGVTSYKGKKKKIGHSYIRTPFGAPNV